MKTIKANHIYIAVIIILAVLLIICMNRDDAETNSEALSGATSTQTNTIGGTSNTSSGAKKPAGSTGGTSIVRPTSPTPTSAGQTSTIPSAASLNGLIFQLTVYNGSALASGQKPTLSFDSGSLNAKFCNSISGNFVLDKTLISANNLISTKMYCASPANLMEMENAFISMLNLGSTIYRKDNTLIISNSNTVMVFSGFTN